jgi:uncharacterized membrane protein YvbJ
MYCTKCGTLVEKSFVFCLNCGVTVDNDAKDQTLEASKASGGKEDGDFERKIPPTFLMKAFKIRNLCLWYKVNALD